MKKSKVLKTFFLLVAAFLMQGKADAQIIEVGATGGLSYYVGDINPKKHFSQNELGFGAVVRYYQNFRWAFRFQYSNMNLTSSDAMSAFRPERDLSFNSTINDFALMAEFNFFDYWTGSNRNYITPYIFAGLSYFTCNTSLPKGLELDSEGNVEQSFDSNGNVLFAEEYENMPKGSNFSVPFGIGVKYSVFKRIGMSLEWRIHKTFTDEIDKVVDNYSYEIVTNPSLGTEEQKYHKEPMGYKCDWFSMLGLSITYRFNLPKKDACYSGAMNIRY